MPAVIRLGGNQEERAIETLHQFCAGLDAPVAAYGKDDSPEFCAARLNAMLGDFERPAEEPTAMDETQILFWESYVRGK